MKRNIRVLPAVLFLCFAAGVCEAALPVTVTNLANDFNPAADYTNADGMAGTTGVWRFYNEGGGSMNYATGLGANAVPGIAGGGYSFSKQNAGDDSLTVIPSGGGNEVVALWTATQSGPTWINMTVTDTNNSTLFILRNNGADYSPLGRAGSNETATTDTLSLLQWKDPGETFSAVVRSYSSSAMMNAEVVVYDPSTIVADLGQDFVAPAGGGESAVFGSDGGTWSAYSSSTRDMTQGNHVVLSSDYILGNNGVLSYGSNQPFYSFGIGGISNKRIFDGGSQPVEGREIALHSGDPGVMEYTVIRWEPDTEDVYTLMGYFYSVATGRVDFTMYVDGVLHELATGETTVLRQSESAPYCFNEEIQISNYVDFVFGGQGTINGNENFFQAWVMSDPGSPAEGVPEPGTWVLACLAILGFGALRRRNF